MRITKHGRQRAIQGRATAPVALAIVLFAGLIFAYLLPQQERLIIERKKEMLRELTASAVSVLAEHERDAQAGLVSLPEAQRLAIARLRDMRYGREGKDYFWITDHEPRMVMHPYRRDLEGKALNDFRDPDGVPLFVEARTQVQAKGDGFIEYRWQWKDDAGRVVPKLSYVRGFGAWGYIVGTGIYLDDVHQEMSGLRTRLLSATLAILVAIVLLMLYGRKQTLNADATAREALQSLRDSEEKYRLLSEAVGEGSLLTVDGQVLHTNRALLELLGCTLDAIIGQPIDSLFADSGAVEAMRNSLTRELTGSLGPIETHIRCPSGGTILAEVTACAVELLGKPALSLVVRDLSAGKRLAAELAHSRERARWLAGRLGLGLFRARADKAWPLLEVDSSLVRMLGLASPQDLLGQRLLDFVADPAESLLIQRELLADASLRGRVIRVRDNDGRIRTWSISAAIAPGTNGGEAIIDGMVEESTWRRETEWRRRPQEAPEQIDVLTDAKPIGILGRPALICTMDLTLLEVTALLTQHAADACLVTTKDGNEQGFITWKTLAIALGPDGPGPNAPCQLAMMAPVPALAAGTPQFAALRFAASHCLNDLPIRQVDGSVKTIINTRDLFEAQERPLASILLEFAHAQSEAELLAAHDSVPGFVRALLDCGAGSAPASRTMTALSDAFTKRATELAVLRMGGPPTQFAFLALGSEGRGEETLVTDQDNAIVWADVPQSQQREASRYFIRLGESINTALNQAGYAYCEGKVMASNPEWNMSLSLWKTTVARWVEEADPKALLAVNTFFDFRAVCSDFELADALRQYTQTLLANNHAFFHNFAAKILEYRPPLGFFGKILTETEEGHTPTFNIKAALVPLVGFARLHALRHGVEVSGTLERLDLLRDLGVLTHMGHRELTDAFNFLMALRLRHQATQLADGHSPHNHINPKSLSRVDLAQLREALGQIQLVQERVRLEWT